MNFNLLKLPEPPVWLSGYVDFLSLFSEQLLWLAAGMMMVSFLVVLLDALKIGIDIDDDKPWEW